MFEVEFGHGHFLHRWAVAGVNPVTSVGLGFADQLAGIRALFDRSSRLLRNRSPLLRRSCAEPLGIFGLERGPMIPEGLWLFAGQACGEHVEMGVPAGADIEHD